MEKRKEKRTPVGMGCWLVYMDEAACFETLDVSETGMSVLMSTPLPIGKQVDLQFFTPESADPVNLPAEVVWSTLEDDQGSMGLRFLKMDERTGKAVKELSQLVRLQKRF